MPTAICRAMSRVIRKINRGEILIEKISHDFNIAKVGAMQQNLAKLLGVVRATRIFDDVSERVPSYRLGRASIRIVFDEFGHCVTA